MENQEETAMIAVDLNAAFDTVDHIMFVDVLQAHYGLQDTALFEESLLHCSCE
ncbi:hypothetical protein DPMN_087290 [Dreissena polymorpha]|uniref:Reverse transcriptase domain-containing protein n=1 Tax=Dreissena polymorpha TaxID=45954 RepID=A0A9D4KTX2_DREPO|nr:hypothetical protein DPMN_087290 [Dreissena polymorpha]